MLLCRRTVTLAGKNGSVISMIYHVSLKICSRNTVRHAMDKLDKDQDFKKLHLISKRAFSYK